MNNLQPWQEHIQSLLTRAETAFSDADTYQQLLAIGFIVMVSWLVSSWIWRKVPLLRQPPEIPKLYPLKNLAFNCGRLIFPLLTLLFLQIALKFTATLNNPGTEWLLILAHALNAMLLFSQFIHAAIKQPFVAKFLRWVGLPLLFLHLIGVLDEFTQFLDNIAFSFDDTRISLYNILKTTLFGLLLFWMGRATNKTGQVIIRRQEDIDVRTRELIAKLFEIGLFIVFALLLLKTVGINLTALAVFGGAIGVGLGFGLQSIASNFISGMIILFDRSVRLGDFIELEDGKLGMVRQMRMRSTTLETFDGKDIVVPNETFISSSFTNWTQKDDHQRYRVDFSVGYRTNVRECVELIKEAVGNHPQVLSGEEVPLEKRPDCEIDSFGDNGINMFVEFWMEGIDDGRNRVGGDLLLIILETLQNNGIEIPFPQREVRVLNPNDFVARQSVDKR